MTRFQAARHVVALLAGALLLLTVSALPAGAAVTGPAAAVAPVAPPPGVRTAAQLQGAGARPAGCAATTSPTTGRAATTDRAATTSPTTGRRVAHCYLAFQPAPAQAAVRGAACAVSTQAGWSPCNLQSAYKITSLVTTHGKGQTIAVIDAYNDPKAAADLATYRSTYGLPRCTVASGCFKKVNQSGVAGSYPTGNMGWGQEISIDLDMISAVCPRCHILLVEANSSGFSDLFAAEQTAISLGAHVVSNSWGTGEFSGENSFDSTLNTPGVAITYSSGDGAYQGGVQYPSASPYVTSVGGTMLAPATNARGWTETTWVTPAVPPTQGSGSGCSAYENKPTWQTDAGCGNRTTADVSAVAANVLGYDTYEIGGGGYYFFFGTSVSSPITAGMYGLAANAAAQSVAPASLAYAHTSHLFDITSGLATGTCSPIYLCKAGKGYDGPTGLGTPKGIGAY
jgi:subtilase family serine protease